MKKRPRIYYTDAQKAVMWERWREGHTLHQIGKLFDRPHTSIHRILAETGGTRPPQRRRSSRALSLVEREEISSAIAEGESLQSISRRLGRVASIVSREISRNGGMHRSIGLLPGSAQCDYPAAQRAAQENAGLPNAG